MQRSVIKVFSASNSSILIKTFENGILDYAALHQGYTFLSIVSQKIRSRDLDQQIKQHEL